VKEDEIEQLGKGEIAEIAGIGIFPPMNTMTVYAYSGCGTCRNAQKWLQENGLSFALKAIRETPPTVAELQSALDAGVPLKSLFNVSGGTYKEMDMKTRLPTLSTAEALELLASNGNLVKRPFVLHSKGVTVGFKIDEWKATFLG
jgi:arsenate reductase